MRRKLFMLFCCLSFCIGAFAQVSISGKVTDQDGFPLAGANISVKGTNLGALTDINGLFQFPSVSSEDAVLVFSYIGFTTQEVRVGNQREFNIALEEDLMKLDEVVVVAYGTARKKDLTGSITAVDGKTIAVQAQSSVTRALEGSVAGLQAASLDGQPGLDVGIRIRGVGTANQNNSNALVVIDGAPAAEGVNVLASINSKDIESVTVLKDAASTALYGSRGANGVILITTKSGKSGKTKISVEGRWGINRVGGNGRVDRLGDDSHGDLYEYVWLSIYNATKNGHASGGAALSASEAATFASQHLFDYSGSLTSFQRNTLGNWMSYNVPGAVYTPTSSGTTQSSTMTGAYLVNENGKLNPAAKQIYGSGDYADELMTNAFRQEYNISASGATDKIDYHISVGMLEDPSYVSWSAFERYSGRANVNARLNDWLKAGAKMGYASRNTESQGTRWGRNPGAATQNIFYWINAMNPIRQLYARDANGNYMYDDNGKKIVHTRDAAGNGTTYSPVGPTSAMSYDLIKLMEQSEDKVRSHDMNMKGYIEAKFLKDFTFTANISYDKYFQKRRRFYNTESAAGFVGSAMGSAINRIKYEYTYLDAQQLLNYNRDFGPHHVDAMVGHEYWQYDYEEMRLNSAYSLLDDFKGYVNFLGTAGYSTFAGYGGNLNKQTMESYFGRANYIYDDKYYISGSLRRDGSSKFKYSKNRWGTFWSIGGGWRVTGEDFMESTKSWLDNMKIRASYGLIGNQNGIGLYSGYQTWGYGGANWTSGSATYPQSITLSKGGWVNDGLTWEKVKTFDVGVDFSLFGRLHGTFDFYNKQTTNAIWGKPVSFLTAGQSTLQQNSAGIRNRGFEIELSYDIISNKDMRLTVSTNGTHYNTIVTKVPEGTGSDLLNGCWEASADAWGMAGTGGSSALEYLRGIDKDYYNMYLYKYGGVAGNTKVKEYYYSTTGEKNAAAARGLALYYHRVNKDDVEANTYPGKAIGDDVLVTDYALANKYEMGDALPDWIGGFSASFQYKNFDISAIFSYQLGGRFLSVEYANGLYMGGTRTGGSAISNELKGNTWTEDNVNAKFPMALYGSSYKDGSTIGSWAYTDMALFKSSYMSLKNVTLGYTVPENILKRLNIAGLRIFASADNCMLLYGHSGVDPRWSIVGGLDVGAYSYPYMATYSIGLNLDF